jgi:hypothetical protein
MRRPFKNISHLAILSLCTDVSLHHSKLQYCSRTLCTLLLNRGGFQLKTHLIAKAGVAPIALTSVAGLRLVTGTVSPILKMIFYMLAATISLCTLVSSTNVLVGYKEKRRVSGIITI